MEQPVERFIRKNAGVAAACNFVLNPAFAWLVNPHRADVPLHAGILPDTGITCVIMALLISLFVTADTTRALTAGSIDPLAAPPCPRLLRRFPARPWRLGLCLGGLAALLAVPCLLGLFGLLGVSGLSFAAFATFKAVYTPPLAYVLTRWVILRTLAGAAS